MFLCTQQSKLGEPKHLQYLLNENVMSMSFHISNIFLESDPIRSRQIQVKQPLYIKVESRHANFSYLERCSVCGNVTAARLRIFTLTIWFWKTEKSIKKYSYILQQLPDNAGKCTQKQIDIDYRQILDSSGIVKSLPSKTHLINCFLR